MGEMKLDGVTAPGDLVGQQGKENTSQHFPHFDINEDAHKEPHVGP